MHRATIPILALLLAASAAIPGGAQVFPTRIHDQVTAHDNQFWVGATPVTLRGVNLETQVTRRRGQLERIAGTDPGEWGMNLIRLRVHWAMLEPNPPTPDGSGGFIHSYDPGGTYVAEIKKIVGWARNFGATVIIDNHPLATVEYGYPDWVYTAPYNSLGIDYAFPATAADVRNSQSDFWTIPAPTQPGDLPAQPGDPLRQQFMLEQFAWLARQLKSTPGIAGYEVLNEPQQGNPNRIPPRTQATHLSLEYQFRMAQAVRAEDPDRIIFITTRYGFAPGLEASHLTGSWSRPDFQAFQALGNVAFDLHDYWGARWGNSIEMNPKDERYLEGRAQVKNRISTHAQRYTNPAPPYIGTLDAQMRYLSYEMEQLAPWGFPLFVGEFGNDGSLLDSGTILDPGIYTFYGTILTALAQLDLSWAQADYNGSLGILNGDSTTKPWSYMILNAVKGLPAHTPPSP